ncbi:hypothetical protein ASPWEDRAFT_66683 [Aspergillus wentii DTO 134E9]|uniref:SMP-LTD domain-containing protein n=1 Tax=Aspergillus wentii DTO 134E9 TaxID=1073089 RepID=A0A1L9RYG3_ASPWE|nr:uncharacterized protein ASPWEDRAFT_66683 [Aspergillus wentii DTO 134E9]KAI9931407.1 hypothetical protein MW887_009982 [Aspergillus wentii]OJJ39924.1 hypothetical protein ASPWEDRAFT_66683 [Aspergillus wentii DTO 134E9]
MGKSKEQPIDLVDVISQTYSESKIIVVACLTSWLLCRLNFGAAWLLLILAFLRTQHQLSLRRAERSIRDELIRGQAEKTLQKGESVEWINSVIGKLWHLYEPQICNQIVRYVNHELGGQVDSKKVVIHSLALFEQPLRVLKIKAYSKPNSPNFILDAEFCLKITPPDDHRVHLLEIGAHEPLIDMAIVHTNTDDHKAHDLAVQVKNFTGTGVVRFEIDLESLHPHLLQPHIELEEKPKMDCTIRTISHHHFPFHFAHHVDWRRVVEMQIRAGLGRAFHQPLPLPFGIWGEGMMVKIMRGMWHLQHLS